MVAVKGEGIEHGVCPSVGGAVGRYRYRDLATTVLVFWAFYMVRNPKCRVLWVLPSPDKVLWVAPKLHLKNSLITSFCGGPGVGEQTALG